MYKYLILFICLMTVHVYKIIYPNKYSTKELSQQSFFIQDAKYKTKIKKV